MEDFHCRVALVELDVLGELVEVLVELVEELEELDDAHVIDKSFLELRREALLGAHELGDLDWLRLDLNRVELVVPQMLERHGVVVLDVVPWHLVHFGVDARVLPLYVGVVVAVLVLAQRLLGFDVVDALASRCRVED